MDDNQEAELRRIQDLAVKHAIEEMDGAGGRTLATKEDRGDRGFLTSMAGKSLGVAVKIEQFILLRKARGELLGDDDSPQSEAQAAHRLITTARADVREVLERVSKGSKHRV